MKKYVIGVDIGGTKIAAGVVDNKGQILDDITLPTLAQKGYKVSIQQVYKAIEYLLKTKKKSEIKGIGICAPGPLDPIKGVVHNPPNLLGWKEVPLAKLIKEKFKIKTIVENDANAAGLGEMLWGAAKGYKNIFYVTVSTGIGTGIILNEKIYHGKNGMAGEGGHVVIKSDNTIKCGCGMKGCIESIASGPATAKRLIRDIKKNPKKGKGVLKYAKTLGSLKMEDIAKAAKAGDKTALDAIKYQADILGVWLGSMINVLDPEIIVIGGGVSMIGNLLFTPLKKATVASSINIFASKTPIVRAKLKKHVGLLGAAAVVED